MNRRSFIHTTATASLVLLQTPSLLALEAENTYRKEIGIQLYTLRNQLAKDPVSTLKQVAAAGYQQVELFGFPHADPLTAGAKEAGLAIHSAHFEWDAVIHPKDAAMSEFASIIEKAHALQLSHLVLPYIMAPDRQTLDDYKKIAAHANQAAAMAKAAGIQLSYHNHNFEFEPKEGGKRGYDIFMEEFSADMQFEIDVFWIKAAGLDPSALIQKLSGRVSQLHLKDLKEGIATPSYSTELPAEAFQELGDGTIPMEPILLAAKNASVKHCHVEQDQSPDPIASIQQSMAYLRKL
jgi:sugar phosphate isomerase/epimerase